MLKKNIVYKVPPGGGGGAKPLVAHGLTDLSLLSIGSTQEDPSCYIWKNVDWDVKNQVKQTNKKIIIIIWSSRKQIVN